MSLIEFQAHLNVCLLLDIDWFKRYIESVLNDYIKSAKPYQIPEDFPQKTFKMMVTLKYFFLINPELLLNLLKLIKGLFEARVLSQLLEDTTGKFFFYKKYCYM